MNELVWSTARFDISLATPKVMGIVNLTPDSFSDGGVLDTNAGIARAAQALKDGADILDLGAESTRPGATPLAQADEMARLLPVLKAVLAWGVPVSVDTYKPAVMRAALDMGADIINDVWALRWRDADGKNTDTGVSVVAAHARCGVCLMHMHGTPETMQTHPMSEAAHAMPGAVAGFLIERAESLLTQGVNPERIALDPGIGFGKTVAQNFALLPGQQALRALGFPVVAGWSRKSSLGKITDREPADRVYASVAAATIAMGYGANILRVHDVAATCDAVKVWTASNAQCQR